MEQLTPRQAAKRSQERKRQRQRNNNTLRRHLGQEYRMQTTLATNFQAESKPNIDQVTQSRCFRQHNIFLKQLNLN